MKILLPIDGSAAALEAVRRAIALTQAGLQAEFILANVQAPANLYEMVSAPDAATLEEVSLAAGHHALADAETMLRAAELAFSSEVVSGDPGNMLLDVAERFECDLIVMQTSGAGELRQALLGSVSHSVLHGAGIPVMLVKAVGD